jgi:hypothetical protein
MQKQHINAYGPMASGKTRNAEALREHYGCKTIVDEGKVPPGEVLAARGPGPHLFLTIQPIQSPGFRTVYIEVALAEIRSTALMQARVQGARHVC